MKTTKNAAKKTAKCNLSYVLMGRWWEPVGDCGETILSSRRLGVICSCFVSSEKEAQAYFKRMRHCRFSGKFGEYIKVVEGNRVRLGPGDYLPPGRESASCLADVHPTIWATEWKRLPLKKRGGQ